MRLGLLALPVVVLAALPLPLLLPVTDAQGMAQNLCAVRASDYESLGDVVTGRGNVFVATLDPVEAEPASDDYDPHSCPPIGIGPTAARPGQRITNEDACVQKRVVRAGHSRARGLTPPTWRASQCPTLPIPSRTLVLTQALHQCRASSTTSRAAKPTARFAS